MSRTSARAEKMLTWLLVLYGVASLVHFVHNAEYLADYPNLPAWLSRAQIYAVWLAITAVGLAGYWLRRGGHELSGASAIAVYAALGFDGLLHYDRAPFHAHTAAMNLSIWFEVATAALLLGAVVAVIKNRRTPRL